MGNSVIYDKYCTDFTIFEAYKYAQINVSYYTHISVKISWHFIKYLFPFVECYIKGCHICTNRMRHWSLNIL